MYKKTEIVGVSLLRTGRSENKYTDNTAVDDLNKKLNQEEIFNRLTNNGVEQGVYMKDGSSI